MPNFLHWVRSRRSRLAARSSGARPDVGPHEESTARVRTHATGHGWPPLVPRWLGWGRWGGAFYLQRFCPGRDWAVARICDSQYRRTVTWATAEAQCGKQGGSSATVRSRRACRLQYTSTRHVNTPCTAHGVWRRLLRLFFNTKIPTKSIVLFQNNLRCLLFRSKEARWDIRLCCDNPVVDSGILWDTPLALCCLRLDMTRLGIAELGSRCLTLSSFSISHFKQYGNQGESPDSNVPSRIPSALHGLRPMQTLTRRKKTQ